MYDRFFQAFWPKYRVVIAGVAFLALTAALVFALGIPAAASEPVPAAIDSTGVLTVTAGGNAFVELSCASGQVRVNGFEPDTGPAACNSVHTLVIVGDAELEDSFMSRTDFSNLTSVRFERSDLADHFGLRRLEPRPGVYMWAEQPVAYGQPPSLQSLDRAAAVRTSGASSDPLNPLAPPLNTTIEAADFDTNATNTGGSYFIPPDPIAAAGPNHVVNVVNVSIEWYNKSTGVQQNSQSLASFFNNLPGSLPYTFTFDPKVIYDQYNDRFVVVTLEHEDTADSDPRDSSYIFVAVSDDNDPNGTWYQQVITSTVNIGTPHWADYPGLAVDDEAIYITNNMFSFGTDVFDSVRLWIMDKDAGAGGGLYNGGTSTVTIHDPDAAVGLGFSNFTLQPAHMFGTPPGNTGTFLVAYSGLTDGVNEFLNVTRVDNPTTSPTFTQQFVALGDIDNTVAVMPDAPQSGSATPIETNDRRALNAVWRNNSLWTTAQVVPGSGGDAGEATAHWVQVNTSNLASLTLTDQGNVGGDDIDPGAYTFMPSVMVDSGGNMAIGFALSSPNDFAGAYYTCRQAGDPAGTVQSTGTLAAGQDFYVRTFGGPRNRWGDYSGMALDPSNGSTFWIYNEYAITRGTMFGGEDGRWGTRYGSFDCTGGGTPTPTPSNFLPAIRKQWAPTPTPFANPVQDPSLEAGTPNAFWTETSTAWGTPLCTFGCGFGGGTGPRTGSWWAWFGGVTGSQEVGSLSQNVTFPSGTAHLTFYLEIAATGTTGFLDARVDGNTVFSVTQADAPSYPTYQQVVVDVSAFADGGQHVVSFNSTTNAGAGPMNIFVDDIAITP